LFENEGRRIECGVLFDIPEKRKIASMRKDGIMTRVFAQNKGKSSGGVRMKRKQKARCAASGSAEVGG